MNRGKIQVMESVSNDKENLDKFAPSMKCDYKANEVQDSIFKSSQKSKYFSSDKVTFNLSQEQKLKSSLPSLLDTYCKTSILDESDDFIQCDSKNKVCRKEANVKSNKTKPAVKSKRNDFETNTSNNELTYRTKNECVPLTETSNSVIDTEKSESFTTGDKNEILKCEICKEDITDLDVYNRSVHVNNCIDKQILNPPEQDVATSERTEPESVFILECPLCFKHFPSPEMRASHIKKCGKSKGLSTQSVIKALELQERHALERISLGLPAKPIKPVKSNKSTVPKRAIVEPKNKAQSDIQLAKALSLSLSNSNKQNEEDNSLDITYVTLKPPTAQQHPGKKNKKIMATPLLVLRTDEERKKLLLDKVATIVTPQNVSEEDIPMDVEEVLTEKKKENPNRLPLLWQLSGKATEKHEYYVENLLDWIQPSDVEVGAKFCHLSQIAGHEIVTQLPCDYTFSTQDEHSTCESAQHLDSPPSLIGSLRSLVASSWMSDVDVHTACGTVIPAHRLLLAVRCPPLKQDLDFCSKTGRVSLKWESTSFDVALQFLNFVYTGSIEIEDSMKSDLLHLANKYEVSDLLKLLLTNENNCKQSDSELNEKVTDHNGTKSSTFAMSYRYQSQLDMEENNICESEEETNMDLDIVYNCINSSLKPTQPYLSKSLTQKDETSSQYLNEPQSNSQGCLDLNCSKPKSVENSPQKCIVYSYSSQEQRSTSPVIFDVNDSDNGADSDSENESIELPANCSQNSNLKECHLEEKELDLYSTESNSSQDSVKFLQSSFSAHNNLPCTPLKETNYPIPVSPKCLVSPLKKEYVSPIINASRNLEKSVVGCHEQISKVTRSDEFCLDNDHETPASDSSVLVNFIHSSLKSPDISKTYQTEFIKQNCAAYQTELSPLKPVDKEKIVNNYEIEVVVKDRSFHSNMVELAHQRTTFTECGKGCEIPTKKSSCSHSKEFSNPENFEHVENSWPLNKASSPEVLICDSDSNPKSPISIPDEEVPSDHEEFPPSQIKFNFSQISVDSLETTLNTLRTNLPEDILENENNFNGQPSTSNGLANSPCSFSPIKRNIKSPVVICFSSDDDEQITTGQSSPKTISSSDHEHHGFKEKVSCTILPNEDRHDMPKDQLPRFGPSTSFEHYEDPPHEYDDYFEPDIPSPLKCNISPPSKPKVSLSPPPREMESVEDYDKSKVTPSRKIRTVKEHHNRKIVTPCTVKDSQCVRFSDSPITPFPDYKNMDTPGIKEALQRIGVKALPRKKAVELLRHVYNETHPLVSGEGSIENDSPQRDSKTEKFKKRKKLKDDPKPAKRKQVEVKSPEKSSATQESDESGSENPEWQGCVPEISFTQFTQDSPSKATKDDLNLIKQYIQSSEELYSNILTYTPLNLVAFHQELKENGIKISIQKLMDFFDEQCITFTCPRKEEYRKKQTARTQRFRQNMIAKLSQQAN